VENVVFEITLRAKMQTIALALMTVLLLADSSFGAWLL